MLQLDVLQLPGDNKSVMGFNLIWLYSKIEMLDVLYQQLESLKVRVARQSHSLRPVRVRLACNWASYTCRRLTEFHSLAVLFPADPSSPPPSYTHTSVLGLRRAVSLRLS